MSKRMLVNAAQAGEVRVAIVEDGILEDLNVAMEGNELIKGNIYKARVVSVEPGLQAAFIDYGAERNGFITFNDIHRRYWNKTPKESGGRPLIQDCLTPGAELLVQAYKEQIGNKGAAMTTDITMPGRFLVLMPYSGSAGVSRKIQDESTRKKLKSLIAKLSIPEEMGIIVRTAGKERTKTELQKDYQQLIRIWGHAQARYAQLKKTGLVYKEPDVVIRSIRDYFKDDIEEIVVDDTDVLDRTTDFFERHAPDVVERVKPYKGKMPIFSNFGLERQLELIASHHVPLESGGSIVINPTEALTSIDVNSGKSRGQKNQDQMALETNLEAAKMVARQVRLRDVGGLLVIDFIDMGDNKHRREVEKILKKALKRDKARVEVGRISRFGLLEMSRQRIKARLLSSTHTTCPTCKGSGFVMSTEVAAMTMVRRIQELAVSAPRGAKIRGQLPVKVALHLLNERRASIAALEEEFGVSIEIIPDLDAHSTRDAFEVKTGGEEKTRDRKDERGERRERRGRGRGRKRNERATKEKYTAASDDDTPYEAPKVVGFISPEKLATADLGPEDEVEPEEAADISTEDEDEAPRRRRRRRRRRGRGRGNEETTAAAEKTESTENEDTTPSEDGEESTQSKAERRAAARERNRARRESRAAQRRENAEKASGEDAVAADGDERGESKPRRSARSAASRLKAKLDTTTDEATAETTVETDVEEKKPARRSRGRRSAADRLKAKLDAPAEEAIEVDEAAAPEPKKKAPARKSRSRRSAADHLKAKLDDAPADAAKAADAEETSEPKAEKKVPARKSRSRRSAADRLKAKLDEPSAEEAKAADVEETPEPKAAKKAPARKSRSRRSAADRLKAKLDDAPADAAKAADAEETPEPAAEKKAPARKTRTRRSAADRLKAKLDDAPAEEAKKPRRSRAKKSDEETAEKKPARRRRSASAADGEDAKPSRSRKKKGDDEEKPKAPRRTRKAKSDDDAAETKKPRRKTAAKASEGDEKKPRRTTRSRTKKAAADADPARKAAESIFATMDRQS